MSTYLGFLVPRGRRGQTIFVGVTLRVGQHLCHVYPVTFDPVAVINYHFIHLHQSSQYAEGGAIKAGEGRAETGDPGAVDRLLS